MKKHGPKPKEKVSIKWSANFAYAIGLIATDGCLYSGRKYINFTSKDSEQIFNFQRALGIEVYVGKKGSGTSSGKKYYVVQIGDAVFYDFLISIGITPVKSKTLGAIKIPDGYFFDFLRGAFDGDGSTYSYWDARWKSSFMFYTTFASASRPHIDWLRFKIKKSLSLIGHTTKSKGNSCYQLKYAKKESLFLFEKMYYSLDVICLSRKKLKIKQMLAIVGGSL